MCSRRLDFNWFGSSWGLNLKRLQLSSSLDSVKLFVDSHKEFSNDSLSTAYFFNLVATTADDLRKLRECCSL